MKLYKTTYRRNFALLLLTGYFLFLTAGILHHHHTILSLLQETSVTEQSESIPTNKVNTHADCQFCYTTSTHFALFSSVQNSDIEIVVTEYSTENDFANVTQLYYLSLSLRAPPFLV